MGYEDLKQEIKEAAYQTVKDVSDFAHEKISDAIGNVQGGKKKPVRYINTTYVPSESQQNVQNGAQTQRQPYVPPQQPRPYAPPQQPMRTSQRVAQPQTMRASSRAAQAAPVVPAAPAQKPVPASEKKKEMEPLPQMRAVKKKSVAPFYLTSAFALGYVCLFGISKLWHAGVFLLLCLTVFGLLSAIFKSKTVYEKVEEGDREKGELPKGEEPAEIPARCGIPEVDRLLHEGYRYIDQLKLANEAIEDPEVSSNIDRMTVTATRILRHVEENPGKANSIRKFMNYYLPTTLKLLNSYYRLSKQGVKGENITGTMTEIERILYTIASAFDKQLDALFQDVALDVNADIAVMESMLDQESLK